MIITISTDKEILFKAELIDPKPQFLVDYANKLRGTDDSFMLSVDFILKRYEVGIEEVRSKSKLHPLPEVRMIIIHRLVYRHGFTSTRAAGYVSRSHSMASHAAKLIHDGYLNDAYYKLFPRELDFKKEDL